MHALHDSKKSRCVKRPSFSVNHCALNALHPSSQLPQRLDCLVVAVLSAVVFLVLDQCRNLFLLDTLKKAVFANAVGGSPGEPAGTDTGWYGAGGPNHPGV